MIDNAARQLFQYRHEPPLFSSIDDDVNISRIHFSYDEASNFSTRHAIPNFSARAFICWVLLAGVLPSLMQMLDFTAANYCRLAAP